MVVSAIFVSAIAGTLIISNAISRGMKNIEKQLSSINDKLLEANVSFEAMKTKKNIENTYRQITAENLESLKKILARNFKIAMNDDEFENL